MSPALYSLVLTQTISSLALAMASLRGGSSSTLVSLGPREGSNVWTDRATFFLLPEEMKATSDSTSVGQGLNPAACPPVRKAPGLKLVAFRVLLSVHKRRGGFQQNYGKRMSLQGQASRSIALQWGAGPEHSG